MSSTSTTARGLPPDSSKPKAALHEKYRDEEDLSRKGAKAQSATAFLTGFLCAFAPLRETYISLPSLRVLFVQSHRATGNTRSSQSNLSLA
jgi:hypothetical protein